jgi:hypothetical protein
LLFSLDPVIQLTNLRLFWHVFCLNRVQGWEVAAGKPAESPGKEALSMARIGATESHVGTGSAVRNSIIGGLIGGVVFGMGMQMMIAPTPEGMQMSMMGMVAKIVKSDSLVVGWIYHLFNSAVIGAIFGWLLGGRITGYGSGLGWGAIFGVFWWILGAQILMPILLGMPAFASLTMPLMLMVGMGSLIGHLMFGLILGAVFVWLTERTRESVGAARPA